jgi:hypothetical protein
MEYNKRKIVNKGILESGIISSQPAGSFQNLSLKSSRSDKFFNQWTQGFQTMGHTLDKNYPGGSKLMKKRIIVRGGGGSQKTVFKKFRDQSNRRQGGGLMKNT